MRVHILDGSICKDSPKARMQFELTRGYWFPVLLAEPILREMGVEIRFCTSLNRACFDCDALVVSSRYHDHLTGDLHDPKRRAHAVEGLSAKVPKTIWFDLRDSSGTPQFEVLPFVHIYAKQYLLREINSYSRPMYGGRLFTEFEHQRFQIEDCVDLREAQNQEVAFSPLDLDYKHKIALAWDLSYGWKIGRHMLAANPPARLSPVFDQLGRRDDLWQSPLTERSIGLSVMLNTDYYRRKTVANQRRRAVAILRNCPDLDIVSRLLPYKRYVTALGNSRSVLSCFGNGEVCYREHEAWCAGAAVIMPDMEHIRTYPSRYLPSHTYHPVEWSLENLIAGVERLERDPEYRISLAEGGQRILQNMFEEDGLSAFARRFLAIVEGTPPDPVST